MLVADNLILTVYEVAYRLDGRVTAIVLIQASEQPTKHAAAQYDTGDDTISQSADTIVDDFYCHRDGDVVAALFEQHLSHYKLSCQLPSKTARRSTRMTLTLTHRGTMHNDGHANKSLSLQLCAVEQARVRIAHCGSPLFGRASADEVIDWIIYHSFIGVHRFYVFDRTGELESVMQSFVSNGVVTYIPFPILHEWQNDEAHVYFDQTIALEVCRLHAAASAEWIVNNDRDEFIVVPSPSRPFTSYQHCMELYRHHNALTLRRSNGDVTCPSLLADRIDDLTQTMQADWLIINFYTFFITSHSLTSAFGSHYTNSSTMVFRFTERDVHEAVDDVHHSRRYKYLLRPTAPFDMGIHSIDWPLDIDDFLPLNALRFHHFAQATKPRSASWGMKLQENNNGAQTIVDDSAALILNTVRQSVLT